MTRKNYKKLVFKVEFLREDHKDCKNIYDKAHSDFMNTIRSLQSELNVYDEELDAKYEGGAETRALPGDNKENTDEFDDVKSNNNQPAWVKSLYRKIALKTHPDRLISVTDPDEKESLTVLHDRATTAHNSEDYSDLIFIAVELKLDLPDDDDVYDVLEQKSKSYAEKITKIKSSLYWIWHHSPEEDKKLIIANFMKMRGWTGKRSGVKKSRKQNHPGQSIAWARKKTAASGSIDK